MKKIFTLIAALCCSVFSHAQVDISTEIICPPGVFTFANGGFSLDSYYVDGSASNVKPMLIMKLAQGNFLANEYVLYITSCNRFLTADELTANNAPANSYWKSGVGIQQPAASGDYLYVDEIEPQGIQVVSADTFYTINMMLDMDYYDQDSIVFVGPPWATYNPCQVYGIFIMTFGYTAPNDTALLQDIDPTNDIAVMPVIYDCYAKPGGNGTGTLSLFKKDIALNIYPNPATDQLNIHQFFERNARVTAKLTDLSGRVVLRKELGKLQGDQNINIDISTLPAGIYTLDVSSIYLHGKAKFVKGAH